MTVDPKDRDIPTCTTTHQTTLLILWKNSKTLLRISMHRLSWALQSGACCTLWKTAFTAWAEPSCLWWRSKFIPHKSKVVRTSTHNTSNVYIVFDLATCRYHLNVFWIYGSKKLDRKYQCLFLAAISYNNNALVFMLRDGQHTFATSDERLAGQARHPGNANYVSSS